MAIRLRGAFAGLAAAVVFCALAALPAGASGFGLFISEADGPIFDRNRVELGQKVEGGTSVETFTLRNTSGQVITIESVEASCGCTMLNAENPVVLPGQTVTFEAITDTTGKTGPVSKAVYIKTNASPEPFRLELVYEVVSHGEAKKEEGALFKGTCASCHVGENVDKKFSKELYDVVCAVCHKGVENLSSLAREKFVSIAADGIEGTSMPGFAQRRKGPLTDRQIESLADYYMQSRTK